MRLLSLNLDKKILERFYEQNSYIIDETYELDDALYHLSVRFYNLVLLQNDDIKECLKILNANYNNATAFVIITKRYNKGFEIKLLRNGAICVLKEPLDSELFFAKIETIHRDNFKDVISHNNYFDLINQNKEVVDLKNNHLRIKGKAYDILTYLVKNKNRPPISKEELIQALWEDPEMVSDNIIEVNINQIRSKLKSRFKKDLIKTVRNRGYKLIE